MSKLDGKMLNLNSLRCFVVAVEQGSLSSAATSLGVAQSALSRQVSQLERQLGCRLLHRTGRGVTPTEMGHLMLPQALSLLNESKELMDRIAKNKDRPSGKVSIAVLPALSRHLIGSLLKKVQGSYPDIRLEVIEAYSGEVRNMLSDGRVDIGIFNRYRPFKDQPSNAIYSAPLYFVGKPNNFSFEMPVRFSKVATLPLVLPSRPNDMRSYFDEICNRRRQTMNVVMEVSSGALIRNALLTSDVFSVLPYHAVAREISLKQLALTPITHPAIKQIAFLETTRKRPLSMASRIIYEIVSMKLRSFVH